MSEYLNQRYRNLSPYTPGEQPLDKAYIKLNTNENPYPPGSGVLKVINEAAVKDLRLYEDPDNRLVIRTLAEHYGVKPSQVCVTCGSDETLDLAIMAFGEDGFAFPDLTYNFYKVFCQLHHTDMQVIPLKNDFTIDVKDYLGLGKGVILANPNAPTGLVLPREKIEEILKADPHHVVVVDEAYIDFNEGGSMIPYVNKYPNLLVVQTFSKARSLAGARVGYGIGSEALISDLERIRNSMNPYGLSRLSQQAAIAAVQEQEYYDENCRKVIATRTWFIQELEKLGISRTAYNKYENGAIRPVRKLKELADLFGVSADYILGGADDEQSDVPAMHRQMKKYMELSDNGRKIVDLTLDAVYAHEERRDSLPKCD